MPSWAGLTHPWVLSGKPPENQLCRTGLFGTSSLHRFSKLPVERYLHLTRWMGATLPLRCLCWDGRATSWCRRDPAASYRLITVESYRPYHICMQLHFTYLQLILFLDTRLKYKPETHLQGHLVTWEFITCVSEAEENSFSFFIFIRRI